MSYIDLRSDTVTMPTDRMRRAMFEAEVGDDVYGDDPTVNRLEKLAAEMMGMEAALFVPSGTFGNQLCVMTHTRRGDEVLAGHDSHLIMHEVGAAAVISGVSIRSVVTQNGTMNPADIQKSLRDLNDIHYPRTGLICVENAHSSGAVVTLENMTEIKKIAVAAGVPVHLDGARIFNAAAHLNVEVKALVQQADSVTFCLSKGLCAPVGSVVAGTKAFIGQARKNRKLMGGGLRQAGILAAAGIVALESMVNRLSDDHSNAKLLADGLSKIEGVEVKTDRLHINMVFFVVTDREIDEERFIDAMMKKNIKINGTEDGEFRYVTNNGVTRKDIEKVVDATKELLDRYAVKG